MSWTIRQGVDPGYSLFDLSDRLRMRGWQAAAYNMVPNITDVVVMRVLVRHGFSRDLADMFLADVKAAMAWLDGHKPSTQQTAAEGGAYTHSATAKPLAVAQAHPRCRAGCR